MDGLGTPALQNDLIAVPAVDTGYRIRSVDTKTLQGRFIRRQISKNQDELIFTPHPQGWEKLRHPSTYSELEGLGVTQRVIPTEGKQDNPSATITLWEKKEQPGKEHYIVFTSKRGDIGDTGPLDIEGYDRHAGVKFLKALAADGAGFTVVTMRGYGNNKGKPSEEGFKTDIEAFVKDWLSRSKREGTNKKTYSVNEKGERVLTNESANIMPYATRTIVTGMSLGTGNAALLACKLTERGHAPAMLALVNPYKRMSEVGSYTLQNLPLINAKKYKEGYSYPANKLEQTLNHKFPTDERIAALSKDTQLLVITSGNDRVIPNSHSTKLMEIAARSGLTARQKMYDRSGHFDLPPEALARSVRSGYKLAQRSNVENNRNNPDLIVERLVKMRDGVLLSSANVPPQKFVPADKPAGNFAQRVASSVKQMNPLKIEQTTDFAEALPAGWLTGGTKKIYTIGKDEIPPVAGITPLGSNNFRLENGAVVSTPARTKKPAPDFKDNGRIGFKAGSPISCSIGGKTRYATSPATFTYSGLFSESDTRGRG